MSSNTPKTNQRRDEQIPTENNQEQTKKTMERQEQIQGMERERNVSDVQKAAALGQLLKDVEFPADKKRIIEYMQQNKSSDPKSQEVISALEKVDDRQYENVSDITKAAGLS